MSKKLMKIYISEDARHEGEQLYHAIIKKLRELKVAGATVTRGIEGYGPSNIIRTTKILDLSVSLPIVIEIIDSETKIREIAPIIKAMIKKGQIFIVHVEVL